MVQESVMKHEKVLFFKLNITKIKTLKEPVMLLTRCKRQCHIADKMNYFECISIIRRETIKHKHC